MHCYISRPKKKQARILVVRAMMEPQTTLSLGRNPEIQIRKVIIANSMASIAIAKIGEIVIRARQI